MERCKKTTDGQHLRTMIYDDRGPQSYCLVCGQVLPDELASIGNLRDHPVVETRAG